MAAEPTTLATSEDAEVIAAAAQAEQDATDDPGIGFVGCNRRGRVLRVRVANRNRQRMRVMCPHGCGEHDTPKSMARLLRPDEAEPELVEIPPDDDDLEHDPPGKGSGRRTVSDAEIFDAIPVGGEVVAVEAARAAGYVGESPINSFTRRLSRMNKRAEKEGVWPPPFIITAGGRGPGKPPTMVRRAET
jgi:hypothetical protein